MQGITERLLSAPTFLILSILLNVYKIILISKLFFVTLIILYETFQVKFRG